MSEQELVERVTAIIRPLHDRPAKRGEWLSEAQIRDTARAAIAAVREALLARTDREPVTAYVDCGGTYGYDADVTFEVEAWLRAALGEGEDAE